MGFYTGIQKIEQLNVLYNLNNTNLKTVLWIVHCSLQIKPYSYKIHFYSNDQSDKSLFLVGIMIAISEKILFHESRNL